MKKLLTYVAVTFLTVAGANAQFLISDFDSFANDFGGQVADNWGGSQGSGVYNINGGPGSNLIWQIANGVETDLSSFGTEVELIATLSNSTGFNVLFLDDTFNLVTGIEAQATFTSSQLDGTTQVASITGDLTGIAGIAITSNGGGTVTGSLDSLQVIPEPSTFALLGLGAGALYLLRRRK